MSEAKHITVGLILGWILGILALVTGIGLLAVNLGRAVTVLIIAALLLPPISKWLTEKTKVSLSTGVKIIAIIGLIGVGSMFDRDLIDNAPNNHGSVVSTPTTQISGVNTSSTPTPTVTAVTAFTPSAAAEPKGPTYQKVFTFKGNGAKKSEPFQITGSRFKISYDCKGSLCQAFLKKTTGEEWDLKLIMNTAGATKDESIFYGSGEYYIDANIIGAYTMTVEDYK